MMNAGLVIDGHPRVYHVPDTDYDWLEDGPDKINSGDEVFVLPLAVSGMERDDIRVEALVLRRSSSVPGAFTRTGIFGMGISVQHVQGYEYIFEGTTASLRMRERLVLYGQSLLTEDGSYRDKERVSKTPIWLMTEAEKS
jgi:hypothetical protein